MASTLATIGVAVGCRSPEPAAPTPAGAEPALWFGGDVFLGAAARGGVEDIARIVGGAAGVVNLEGPIVAGPAGARIDGARVWLANPAESPAWLRAQGIVAASVANNHAGDAGADGAVATARRLGEAGIVAFGGPAGAGRLEVGGTVVTLLAHEAEEPGVAEALAAGLRAGEGTFRVVSLHVTGPPSYLPTPALRAAVDVAVERGADVVVAHGTHVLGPVERRGDVVIAWGLGNLLFDCACTDAEEGLVLRVGVGPAGPGVAEIVPVTAGLGGASARPARDPSGILDLVEALGSRIARGEASATF